MINAYKEGIPAMVSLSPKAPLSTATEPDTLDSVQLIVKDSERFPGTSGGDMASFCTMQRLIRLSLSGQQAHSQSNVTMPYACKGKRLHFQRDTPGGERG